jgi:hemoglobin-like flavoprotein
MMHASDESQIASGHVAQLGKHHAKLGVHPGLYDLWLECLLQAVEECDPMYAPEVDEAWRCVLRKGIAAMKAAGTKKG